MQGLHTPTGPLAAGGLPSLLEKAQPQRPLVLPAGRPAVPTLMGATWMGREGCRSREAVSGTQRAQEGPQRVWPSGCLPPALRPPPWGASFSSAAGRGGESPDPSSELWTRQLFVTAPWGGHSGPLAPPTQGAVGPGQAWHWHLLLAPPCCLQGGNRLETRMLWGTRPWTVPGVIWEVHSTSRAASEWKRQWVLPSMTSQCY